MNYLADTTILVDASRGKNTALNWLRDNHFIVSAVSAGELIQGALDKDDLKNIETFIQNSELLEIDSQVSQKSRDLLIRYSLSHGLLLLDAMIAATALQNNLVLATHNIKHFTFLPGLEVKQPY